MALSRRAFLRAAVVAPVAAALVPLAGQAGTRDYVRFRAATLPAYEAQILYSMNLVVTAPRTCKMIYGITA